MNSRQPDFDWHKPGVWAMIRPGADELRLRIVHLDVCTPWSCRAEFLRAVGRSWSTCVKMGYYVQQFVEVDHE